MLDLERKRENISSWKFFMFPHILQKVGRVCGPQVEKHKIRSCIRDCVIPQLRYALTWNGLHAAKVTTYSM